MKSDGIEESGAKGNRQRLPGLKVGDGYTRHPFDVQFGVRTSGLIAGRDLKSGHGHDRYTTAYFGVAPSVLQRLIRRWQQSRPAAPMRAYTFVDVGAGMGRAVLLASEMDFKAVVGVELHPTLARIARRNVKARQAAVRIVRGDAVEFPWPKGPCVAFLFNPFGAEVMRRMLRAMVKVFAGRPGELDLLYVNNEQEWVLEGRRGFTRVFHGEVKRSKADAIADHRIMANQPDGEYASSNAENCSIWRWGG